MVGQMRAGGGAKAFAGGSLEYIVCNRRWFAALPLMKLADAGENQPNT